MVYRTQMLPRILSFNRSIGFPTTLPESSGPPSGGYEKYERPLITRVWLTTRMTRRSGRLPIRWSSPGDRSCKPLKPRV